MYTVAIILLIVGIILVVIIIVLVLFYFFCFTKVENGSENTDSSNQTDPNKEKMAGEEKNEFKENLLDNDKISIKNSKNKVVEKEKDEYNYE